MGNTVRGFTDGNTFGAVFHFTGFFRTHNLTIRSIEYYFTSWLIIEIPFTFNVTNGVFGFLAR